MLKRIKDWIIKKLGGYTAVAYDELQGYHEETKEDLSTLTREYNQLYEAHGKLSRLHVRLAEEYKECRDILAGLQILKTKIETFRAEAAAPKMMRSEKELKREIENKKQKAVMSLYNDILSQGRFIVVDVKDKGNKYEVTATVSVLEGGVINAQDTQLSEDAGTAGGTQKSDESSQDD